MTNLKKFNDMYANLTESAYNNRPNPFTQEQLNDKQKDNLNEGKAVLFDFSKDAYDRDENLTKGGINLPNDGKVYLQPDKTVTKQVTNTIQTPRPNGGYNTEKVTSTFETNLSQDKFTGFNSYFVTDNSSINESKETYFVTRGSDSYESLHDLQTDWIRNNGTFTLFDSYIPQAKVATKAMDARVAELPDGAVMNVTGHSLGTMVSIQAVANLPAGDINKIGRVVLFQGPDARSSIDKMSAQARKNIETLEAQGKIDYYVNPFDIVSMLNRNKKGVDEIGNVHYLMPISGTSTFQMDAPYGSSHDFGQYQFNKDGSIKEANVKDNPEIFEAGIRVSRLIDETLEQVTRAAPKLGSQTLTTILGLLGSAATRNPISAIVAAANGYLTYEQAKKIYDDFSKKYNGIIADTAKQMKRNDKISNLKNQISRSSGGQKVKLRAELAGAVSEEAKSYGREYEELVKNCQQETEDEIDRLVQEVFEGAHGLAFRLPYYEVDAMIQSFQKDNLWDNSQAEDNLKIARKYKEKLDKFSDALKNVSNNIQSYDGQAGKSLFNEKPKTVLQPWDLHF